MPFDAAHDPELPIRDHAGSGQAASRPRLSWAVKPGARAERNAVKGHRKQLMAERETADAVGDLRRLREIGMEHAEGTVRNCEKGGHAAVRDAGARPLDSITAFVRVARAVRQIIVLEQELLGQRPVPIARAAAAKPADAQPAVSNRRAPNENADSDLRERSDLDDLNDYDDRPFQQVVSGIRAALDLAAPVPVASTKPPARPAAFAKAPVFAKSPIFANATPTVPARAHLAASTALATPTRERGPPWAG